MFRPQLFIFLGDNIYGDTENMLELKSKYDKQNANSDFHRFRHQIPILGTWDDHDYGLNDGGEEFAFKEKSKELFIDFFNFPENSEIHGREGVYHSKFIEHQGLRIQILLLDLRSFRSPLYQDNTGAYAPNPDPLAKLLGSAQWNWLECQLDVVADVRILGSSIQLTAEGHRWEKWSNFPKELDRFYQLLESKNIQNLVVISGDMHFAELSRFRRASGLEIYELTSSGLTHFESAKGIENLNRLECFDESINFGTLEIEHSDDAKDFLTVKLAAHSSSGQVEFQKELNFAVRRRNRIHISDVISPKDSPNTSKGPSKCMSP